MNERMNEAMGDDLMDGWMEVLHPREKVVSRRVGGSTALLRSRTWNWGAEALFLPPSGTLRLHNRLPAHRTLKGDTRNLPLVNSLSSMLLEGVCFFSFLADVLFEKSQRGLRLL